MRVLVTGGNRYIGLSLVHELARLGHQVTVFNSHEARLPAGVRRLHGDRRIPGVLEEVLSPHRDAFDAVFDNTAYTVARRLPLLLVHWGEAMIGGAVFSIEKALRELDWKPRFGLESGYRDAYEWYAGGSRDRYEFDFSFDDEVLSRLQA